MNYAIINVVVECNRCKIAVRSCLMFVVSFGFYLGVVGLEGRIFSFCNFLRR